MRRRVMEMMSMLILFFHFAPATFAMITLEGDEENISPNIPIQRIKLSKSGYEQIMSIVSTSIISPKYASEIVSAVTEAAGKLSLRELHKRKISTPKPPKTPPPHARATTLIGPTAKFYGTNSPIKKVRTSNESNESEEVIEKMDERYTSINAVYSWIMVKEHHDLYIEPKDLIDVETLLPKHSHYRAKDVDLALLQTEIAIRKWIKGNNQFVYRTIYVGLSVDTESRIYGHRKDYNCQGFLSRKIELQDLAGEAGYNVRMRPLIHHVPDDLLPLFECLAGKLFSAHIFSASTLLGNGEAKERLEQYWTSKMRERELKKQGLLTITEDIKNEIFLRAKLLDSF